jgi:GT2 family glycosyltransferase
MAVRSAVSDRNEDAGWSSGLCGIFTYLVMRLEKTSDVLSKQYIYNRNSLNMLLDSLDSISVANDFDREPFIDGLTKLLRMNMFSPKVKSLLNKYRACRSETVERQKSRISIYAVVVLHNGMKWYGKCFGSLRESSFPVHIVAIDNASGDETVSHVSANYPDVCLIRSERNLGFAKACNIGIRHALEHGADYVFLLNQDAWIERETLRVLLDVFLKNTDTGIVSPVHLNSSGKEIDKTFINYLPEDFVSDIYTGCMKAVYHVPFVNAAAWLVSCECIKNIGCFDTDLFVHYGEDNNFCQRALYHGYGVYIHTGTTIFHDRPGRSYGYMRSLFTEENEFLSEKKNLGNINVYYDMKKHLFDAKISILVSLFLMRFGRIGYLRRYTAVLNKIRESRELNVRNRQILTRIKKNLPAQKAKYI